MKGLWHFPGALSGKIWNLITIFLKKDPKSKITEKYLTHPCACMFMLHLIILLLLILKDTIGPFLYFCTSYKASHVYIELHITILKNRKRN